MTKEFKLFGYLFKLEISKYDNLLFTDLEEFDKEVQSIPNKDNNSIFSCSEICEATVKNRFGFISKAESFRKFKGYRGETIDHYYKQWLETDSKVTKEEIESKIQLEEERQKLAEEHGIFFRVMYDRISPYTMNRWDDYFAQKECNSSSQGPFLNKKVVFKQWLKLIDPSSYELHCRREDTINKINPDPKTISEWEEQLKSNEK